MPAMAIDAPARPEPAPARPDLAPTAGEPLRRNRDFQVVLVGQGISSFGDAITATALPLLVLALTGSGFAMGFVGVLTTLPDLIFGLVAGAWADRWDRRWMMLGADLGRAVLTAAVPVSVLLGGPTMAVILVVTFPLNVLRVMWLAAWTACVPGLVGRDLIARANATFEAVFNVGWVVGPAIAGVLATVIGPGPTIAVDAASFLVSSASLFLVRRSLRPEPRPDAPHLLADIREGVAFVAGHAMLRTVIAFWASAQVVFVGITTAIAFYLVRDQGHQMDSVGFVLSGFSLGALGGAVMAARTGVVRVGRVMLVGLAAEGATVLVIAAGLPELVIVGAALLAGIAESYVAIGYLTLRTVLSPDALLGRVGSVARTISVGLSPIGSLVTGVLLDTIGGGRTLVAIGSALLVVTLAFGLVPGVRRARDPGAGRA